MSDTDSNQHQDNAIPPFPAGDFILFILLTGAMIIPGILSPNPQNTLSFIAIVVDIIIFFRLTTYLTKNSLSIVVKKVVHYIQQCRVAVSRVMHSIFRHKWPIKAFAIALAFPVSLTLTGHWKEVAGKITAILEFFIIDNKPLGISILITFIFALIIFHKNIITTFQKFISGLTSKYFIFTLASLAFIGALSALSIPSYTSWFREPGYTSAQQDGAKETPEKVQETPASTPSPTGNKAAEVEQKSTSDLRLHLLYITGGIIAILGLIETNRKNSQDHIREVHAARRDRYIEAVDKLSSEQAPVRLGGVYALAGLIDEWLDDDNVDEETRMKEGQVIINNLCSYIRSSFPLAVRANLLESDIKPSSYGDGISGKGYAADQAAFREEQDVRQAIFIEMSKRFNNINDTKGDVSITSGTWSEFNFDFARAPIFYPLDDLTIENAAFSNARFYTSTNFNNVSFIQKAKFDNAIFTRYTNFKKSVFSQGANFNGTKFFQGASFSDAVFTQNANFSGAIFRAQDVHIAITSFCNATFTQEADFRWATFTQEADFSEATFTQKVKFNNALFENYEPTFANEQLRARFSVHTAQEDYNFSVRSGSKPIHTRETKLDDVTRRIPIGAVLFDPSSPRDENGKYRESPPA